MSYPTAHNGERISEMRTLLSQIEDGNEGEDVPIGTLNALMTWVLTEDLTTPRDFLAEQGLEQYL